MEIEKNISIFIERQFPGIYREDGPELVQLVKDYYTFLETQTNQSIYVSRRMFEYRDIDTTLSSMLIFFKKKFLADLPLRESSIRVIIKNILDLYRRKGTPAGIELFFAIFFQEFDVEIIYPAEKMLKISNSKWRQGVYLQMFPNTNVFLSKTEKQYSYKDLISKNITGSASGAKAAVSKINFMILNGTKTPIVYIDSVQGNFERYDDIIANINGEAVSFGRISGSLNEFEVDTSITGLVTAGNKVGDVLDVVSELGISGKAIVSEITDELSGEIVYDLEDGGYGYTVDNTRLLVSDQTLILNNTGLGFTIYERLEDTLGNQGIVIGQSISSVGLRMNSGESFSFGTPISTLDRSPNVVISVQGVVPKNTSSPGVLFPDGGNAATDVIVGLLTNTSVAEVITDVIAPFVGVNLDAADYETAAPMSGFASPVNLSTPLDEAFAIQSLTIGRIGRFDNIRPGLNYVNQVWAIAEDDTMRAFDRKNQILKLSSPGDAGIFNIGEVIQEDITSIEAIVTEINTAAGYISVTPFDYYGFSGDNNIIRANLDEIAITGVEVDYNSKPFGFNAIVNTETEFAVGRIKRVLIQNSGFGYVDGFDAMLVDADGVDRASGIIRTRTQGKSAGYWADFSSHANGYIANPTTAQSPILPTQNFVGQVKRVVDSLTTTPIEFETWGESIASDGFAYLDINEDGFITSNSELITSDVDEFLKLSLGIASAAVKARWDNIIVPALRLEPWYYSNTQLYTFVETYNYYNSAQKIQDSDFYQEYSYQIKSSLSKNEYEKLLKQNVHLAGTKMFGDFIYKILIAGNTKARFVRFFNDDGRGSPLDIADVDTLEASVTNFTVDSTFVTADHIPI
jgi:hypothetical protein